MTLPTTALQLRSLIKSNGELELSLAEVPVPTPAADEVLVRMEAAPVNPSDLGLLFGMADLGTAKASGTAERPVITATVPEKLMKGMAGRVGEAMPVGNEGAGVVVQAGASPAAQALMGKTVAIIGAPCTPSTVRSRRGNAWSCPLAHRRATAPRVLSIRSPPWA